MLFSVRISECGNEWEVQGVRGELAGVAVAQAEAVFMGEALKRGRRSRLFDRKRPANPSSPGLLVR